MFNKPKFKYSIERNTPGLINVDNTIMLSNDKVKARKFLHHVLDNQKQDADYFRLKKKWRA